MGCFLTYTPISGDRDPQPDPPAVFLDPPRVMRLCREMERVRSVPADGGPRIQSDGRRTAAGRGTAPDRAGRAAGADGGGDDGIGGALRLDGGGGGEGPRLLPGGGKAVVGDGGNWIGPLAELHFPGLVQVLDFLHLLVHLYAAATAAHRGRAKLAWSLYERWLRWAWSGQVQPLIAGLQAAVRALWGQPPPKTSDDDPRRIVSWPWSM